MKRLRGTESLGWKQPSPRDFAARGGLSLGALYNGIGRHEKAIEELREAKPPYPLAPLGLTRAALLQGDTAKAQKSSQEFFTLWKDADADGPVLIAAKKEFEKLK